VQFAVQVVLAVTLGPGASAASSGDVVEPTGCGGGTKQPVWQVAACELQVIMQVVVVKLCADAALTPAAVAAVAARANAKSDHRMTAALRSRPRL
jgi:hypothetical protein